MSVHYEPERRRYVVRWRQEGRNRCRRFETEDEAVAFNEQVVKRRDDADPPAESPRRDGVYVYPTTQGPRWRFVFRHADGSTSSRRGYTSRQAAVTARRKLLEAIEREEIKPARETFGSFWIKLLAEKRPYMSPGSLRDFETHGRKRLSPFFGDEKLARIDEDRVRAWLAALAEFVEAGELAPKTVNNARTCLSVTCNVAVRRGLMPRNPCDGVPPLPLAQEEIDYLRLAEIGPYLDACPPFYRTLAETLIGTGARVSEVIAFRWSDIDLERAIVRVYRQRVATEHSTGPTKSRRFRSVQIGPRLRESLTDLGGARRSDSDWVFLCPQPKRGRYAHRRVPVPPHRKTVHDWHEAALVDAGIRDMPLHSLRHTAAASWLATGQPLIFVQRQLGHKSITTTERHYGHLESSFNMEAVARTEQAILKAAGRDH